VHRHAMWWSCGVVDDVNYNRCIRPISPVLMGAGRQVTIHTDYTLHGRAGSRRLLRTSPACQVLSLKP
jgi:hypothetical protein